MRFVQVLIGLLLVSGVSAAGYKRVGVSGQGTSGTEARAALKSEGALPKDVYPDSRNRLPLFKREDLDEHGKKAYDAAFATSRSARRDDATVSAIANGRPKTIFATEGGKLLSVALLL